MSVVIRTDQALEAKLQLMASAPSNAFFDRNAVYWPRYVTIKQWLADEYYQSAGAGLAREGERYTRHDISHVDDVIDTAGKLLGAGIKDSLFDRLEPYETYVLLLAILLHDAGNARQRQHHEKQPKLILAAMGALPKLHSTEARLIASIAEAHGGRAPDGGKDTIAKIVQSDVVTISSLKVRARLLAAVLRLADELSENPHRADPQALVKPYSPPESVIHNLYCKIIDTGVDYEARTLYLNFSIPRAMLDEEFVLKARSKKKILLVDYIVNRIEKCEMERRYCNRFLYPIIYDRIRVKVEIFDHDEYSVLERFDWELADEGYPAAPRAVKSIAPNFDGALLRKRYQEQLMDGGAQ